VPAKRDGSSNIYVGRDKRVPPKRGPDKPVPPRGKIGNLPTNKTETPISHGQRDRPHYIPGKPANWITA